MRHQISTLAGILNKLKILGFYKGSLEQDVVNVWSDALDDLTDEHLLAGYDWYKKHGSDSKAGLNSSQFRTTCKESFSPRPEYRLPVSKQLEEAEGISAREWIQRLIKREVVIFNNLPEPERTENYKKHLKVISRHSHFFQSLQADAQRRSNKLEAMLEKVSAYSQAEQDKHKAKIDELTNAYTSSLTELEALAS